MLQNIHLTIMQKVFGMDTAAFAGSTGIAPEIIA
jgi:hypothetical protein